MAPTLARARAVVHSRRKRRPQAHCAGSARSRHNNGASSRPSHFKAVHGARGLAQGSAWLTEIWPPLAKLVSCAGRGWRSITVTSWPSAARYQALATPTTPAPSTVTRIVRPGNYLCQT
jgi:hypothetical protein